MVSVLMGILLIIACLPSTAYAWTKAYVSDTRTYNINPTYQNLNKGMINSYGNYFANCRSEMTVYCSSGTASVGSMKVQGVITYGTVAGNEYDEMGVMVSNGNPMAQYAQLTGSKELEVSNLKGHVGALAWGNGSVRSNSGTWKSLDTEYHLVATIDAFGNMMPASDNEGYDLASSWQPGQSNFVGSDGLTYGVPAISSDGDIVKPDMLRVLLDNGNEAYVSCEEMDAITTDAVSRLNYTDEAKRFASYLNEALDADVVDVEIAEGIIDEYKNTGSLTEGMEMTSLVACHTDLNDEVNMVKCAEESLAKVAEFQRVAIPAYSDDGSKIGIYYIEII